jgi:hypothetical protein
MEKTTSTSASANELLLEKAKAINKLSHDSTVLIIESYLKQLSHVSDFYNNLLNSTLGEAKNSWSPDKNFTDIFNANSAAKSAFTSFFNFGSLFSNALPNPFLNHSSNMFAKSIKQAADYHHNLIGAFTSQFAGGNSNPGTTNECKQKENETDPEVKK